MRVATWNVNSLKARIEKVLWWLDRARPDVLLVQETKLGDLAAPKDEFKHAGYELLHHGEGRWNGVAIASRIGIEDAIVRFGDPEPVFFPDPASMEAPLAEARMVSAVCGGVRFVNLYAPNGRKVGTPFYASKLGWFDRLSRWLLETRRPDEPLVIGGDLNVAPEDRDVFDPKICHGGTHVSPAERAAFARLLDWGFVDAYRKHHPEPDRYSWWDYRAGDFHKNRGMRIDHLLVTAPLAARTVAAEIDREARKGKPIPSDHAPVTVDLDEPGVPYDPGWTGAEERIAARRAAK